MSNVSTIVAAPVATVSMPTAGKAKHLSSKYVYTVHPSALTIEPGYNVRTFNPATDKEDAWLLSDVTAVGVTTPLTVRQDGDILYVVAGHRRHAAAMVVVQADPKAGRKFTIPFVVVDSIGSNEKSRVYDMHRSNTGKALTMLQLAMLCAKAHALGDDAARIAFELGGKAPRYITNLLTLANAPESIRSAVDAGRIAGTLVYDSVQVKVAACGKDATAAQKDAARLAAFAELENVLAGTAGKVTAVTVKEHVRKVAGGSDVGANKGYTSSKCSVFDPAGVRICVAESTSGATFIIRALNKALAG